MGGSIKDLEGRDPYHGPRIWETIGAKSKCLSRDGLI